MNLETLCNQVVDLVKNVGGFIKNSKPVGIETKSVNNFVTAIDKSSEEQLVAGLLKILPESGFITEEKTIDKKGIRYNWIIDPIDGTTNFIHGLPPYSISIGLLDCEELVLGVVLEISGWECYYAWSGSKAYRDGVEIHVSQAAKVTDSLVVAGFPYGNQEYLNAFIKTFEHFIHVSHGVRRLGSAAADMVYVACGRLEVFYEYGLSPWDVAGGIVILRQAGGRVSDFAGGSNYLFGGEIVASNGLIHTEFLENINRFMKSKF